MYHEPCYRLLEVFVIFLLLMESHLYSNINCFLGQILHVTL